MKATKNTSPNEIAIILKNNEFFTMTPYVTGQEGIEELKTWLKNVHGRNGLKSVKEFKPWVNLTDEEAEGYTLISPSQALNPSNLRKVAKL